MKSSFLKTLMVFGSALAVLSSALAAPVTGWLDWRGPQQNSTSLEKGLPEKIDGRQSLWTYDLPGQSTPVIANGKLYINGFEGEGAELREVIACFDAETGKLLWKFAFNDFVTDFICPLSSSSTSVVDSDTVTVYMQGIQGILACFTADGNWPWEPSLTAEYGRMTSPNSRTASPLVDKDLVMTRGIT